MIDFVLASTSPARKKLLSEAGIKFRDLAPGVDEDQMVEQFAPQTPNELTELLAKAKAEAIAATETTALVLGCDSALFFRRPDTREASGVWRCNRALEIHAR